MQLHICYDKSSVKILPFVFEIAKYIFWTFCCAVLGPLSPGKFFLGHHGHPCLEGLLAALLTGVSSGGNAIVVNEKSSPILL